MRNITAIRLTPVWLAVMGVFSITLSHLQNEISVGYRMLSTVDEKYFEWANNNWTSSLILLIAGALMIAVSIKLFTDCGRNSAASDQDASAHPEIASILNSVAFGFIGHIGIFAGCWYFQQASISNDTAMKYYYEEQRREGQLIATTYGELSDLFTSLHYVQFLYALAMYAIGMIATFLFFQQVVKFFQLPLIKRQLMEYKDRMDDKTIEIMETLKPYTDKITKVIKPATKGEKVSLTK